MCASSLLIRPFGHARTTPAGNCSPSKSDSSNVYAGKEHEFKKSLGLGRGTPPKSVLAKRTANRLGSPSDTEQTSL